MGEPLWNMANNRTLMILGEDVLNQQPWEHMETMIVMMSLVALLRSEIGRAHV